MLRRLFFLLATVLPLWVCAAAAPQDGIDVQHYTFRLTLNDSTNILSGEATVDILFRKELAVVQLDLASRNAQGQGMTVREVSLRGQTVSFQHQNNLLHINLPQPAAAGTLLQLTVIYSGVPEDGLVISQNKYGDRTFFGDNWPDRARHWLPTVDHPSDKAGVDFIVLAPVHYTVVGNGVKIEESFLSMKQKLTHWHETVPIATKVMVIGAARFAIQRSGTMNAIGVESWVYPQNRLEGFHDYAPAGDVLDFLHNHVGPYSYQKLANVQSTTRYGGMENASNIFYFENSVTGKGGIEPLIAHEVAHQWFGNSVSEKDWHHVWLSEGFATYFTNLYVEFRYGRDALQERLNTERRQVIEYSHKTALPVVFPALPANLIELLSVNSYQKGSWILHMLRQEIGDDAFWEGIREYYRQFQNSNATTDDFKRAMETVSGKDLTGFFKQWLYGAGHPILKAAWRYDNKAKAVVLQVDQEQKALFNITLEVEVYDENLGVPVVEALKVNQGHNKFSIPMAQKPAKLRLDPHVNLLFEGSLQELK